jgi:hypothetical protein
VIDNHAFHFTFPPVSLHVVALDASLQSATRYVEADLGPRDAALFPWQPYCNALGQQAAQHLLRAGVRTQVQQLLRRL